MNTTTIIATQDLEDNPATLFFLDISDGMQLAKLTAQVNALCEQAEGHEQAVIVFRFTACSNDLRTWPGQVNIQDVNRWERAVRRIERLSALIIANASGATGGPALDLLLVTDYRIASVDLQLQLPINYGRVWPGMLMYRLVNQIGLARARQLLMGAHLITAQRALDIGLIDEITDTAHNAVLDAVSRLQILSAEISIRRQLMLEASTTTFEDALGTYLATCDRELRRLRNQQDKQ